jgi:uncharacterized protein (DUF2252 family)
MTPNTRKNMSAILQAILDYNRGRDPERLQRKLKLLRRDAFAFFRGTCHLFYATLPRERLLERAPAVLACGDLHLENFGTYKGDNRLVYFDLNDFDEAALAPCTLELVRFVASIDIAAEYLDLTARQTRGLSHHFLQRYADAIADGKPRWLERATARGMVRDLLQALKKRSRRRLLNARTKRRGAVRRLRIDGRRALPIGSAERSQLAAFLERFGAEHSKPRFFRMLDAARRVAGNGSLGLERFVMLVEGRGSPDGNYLLDLKFAAPSAFAPRLDLAQPRWRREAQRIVSAQRTMQAIAPALLEAVSLEGKSFVLKELQPTADRLDLAQWNGRIGRLEKAVASMAQAVAWGQLRSCGRHGAASLDSLQRYVADSGWRRPLVSLAKESSERVLRQWKEYCKFYDKGSSK